MAHRRFVESRPVGSARSFGWLLLLAIVLAVLACNDSAPFVQQGPSFSRSVCS